MSKALHCVITPDYHGNPYQQMVIADFHAAGHSAESVDALDLPKRLLALAERARFTILHQHWLKEIYAGASSEIDGVRQADAYFDSIERFQRTSGKVVWTVHNIVEHDVSELERKLNIYCLRRMSELADVVHVHTQCSLEKLEHQTGTRVAGRVCVLAHPLYNSMEELPRFLPLELRLQHPPDGVRIVTFGMQRPYKGSLDLLQSFLELKQSGRVSQASLVVAGKIYHPELERFIFENRRKLESVTIINRRLTDTELATLVRYGDVVALPYRAINVSGSYYLAATFGRACICPNIGMFRREVSDQLDAIRYEEGGLASAIEHAAALGREGVRELGHRAWHRCSNDSQQHISKRWQALLESELVYGESVGVEPISETPSTKWKGSSAEPLLSFCIPVMNRLSDIQATLARNLEDNRRSAGRVEFILVCFDENDDTERWVCSEFAEDIAAGYLRFYRAEPLPYWHFGRAKNAFKSLMRGRIYASLDGDNFTGPNGGEHIIEVFERFDGRCVFHQFQGEWGDGTCGRISIARSDYLTYGYDESFLPRQWDELDALLSVLAANPDRHYVCYEGRSILQKSAPFRRYFEEHAWFPSCVELPADSDPLFNSLTLAVGQHDNQYVEDDQVLKWSSVYNHLQSFFKNTPDHAAKIRYVNELVDTQRTIVEVMAATRLRQWVLQPQGQELESLSVEELPLLACLKNETDPKAWYEHYKRLGVTRFLLIDDGSDVPVSQRLPYDDVHVWSPRVGHFRYAKVFWLEVLLTNYCDGIWSLTVDGDEFLDLPPLTLDDETRSSQLFKATTTAERRGHRYFCGFLLDLCPEQGSPIKKRISHNMFQYRTDQIDESYRAHNTSRWSYGQYSDWAFAIDLRYRVNGSFDSLRKFPLIRYGRDMHLNQGFHDLLIDGIKRGPDDLLRRDLLPLLHYKLWQMICEGTDQRRDFTAYHHETRQNLETLASSLEEAVVTAAANDQCYSYLSYSLIPIPSTSEVTITLRGATESTFENTLERNAPFTFIEREGPCSIEQGFFFASNLTQAVEWLRSNTPFQFISKRKRESFTLSAKP